VEVKLAGSQPFDDQHDVGARRAAQVGCLWRNDTCRHAEQSAAACEHGTPSAVGEETEVADTNQAFGQNVDKKTT
jgi:hypothetical protein